MAGYDEDFWGEDFLEGEEGATEGEEGAAADVDDEGAEGAEGTEGAEGAEGGEGGEPADDDEGFSPELLARIEAETQKRVDASIARQFEGILTP